MHFSAAQIRKISEIVEQQILLGKNSSLYGVLMMLWGTLHYWSNWNQ